MALSHSPGGSMTVEAACVLPLLLFFALDLLSAVEMLRFHGSMAFAMRQAGNAMALYGYAYDKFAQENPDILGNPAGEVVFSYLWVREELERLLGEDYLSKAPVRDGKKGLIFAESNLMEDDIISFTIVYRLEMPFAISDTLSFRTWNRYYGRAWTGYPVESGAKKETVYVAENGAVYHGNPGCTHLNLSVRAVARKEINKFRNGNGEKYGPCERCADKGGAVLYVTNDGRSYHGSRECGGLKRTVSPVDKKQARERGYRPCSRCKKEE